MRLMDQFKTLCGIALLWVALSALVYVPTSGGGGKGVVVAFAGFVSFALAMTMLIDALRRSIVERVRRVD